MNSTFKVLKLSELAIIPKRATPFSAGLDLHSIINTTIEPQSNGVINTGISVKLPHSTYGRIAPRSSLSLQNSITVGAGVIDEDYRGPLIVVIFNHSKDKAFHVKVGDRIAQLILEKIDYSNAEECFENEFLGYFTARGKQGFGSSGLSYFK